VVAVRAEVPPLVHRLVGRPDMAEPEANYAKLCLRFVAGAYLARGRVDVPDFRGDALRDPEVHRYAAMVDVVLDGNPDQNALDPQRIVVRLRDGREHAIVLPHVYGHPAVPLSAAENEAKFRRCCGYGRIALPGDRVEALIAAVGGLAQVGDVAGLVRLTLGEG
jgi:2-methylcitrate dehydratase PrpD